MRKIHYYGLDWLRCISCILIVLYHYTYRFQNHEVFSISNIEWKGIPFGSCAIITFFLLSGILAENDLNNRRNISEFIKGKFWRLYPTFWLAMCITLFIEFWLYPQALVSFKDILANLSMLPGILGASPIDGAYWTLQYELIFYMIIVVFKVIDTIFKKNYINQLLLVWSILSVIIYGVSRNCNGIVLSITIIFTLAEYGGAFISGLVIMRIVNKPDNIMLWLTLIIAIVSGFLWMGQTQFLFLIGGIVICFICLFNPKLIINRDTKVNRFIAKFSAVTYPMYLLHQNIGYCIMITLIAMGFKTEWIVIIPIVFVIFIAMIIHMYFENHLIVWIKKVGRKND